MFPVWIYIFAVFKPIETRSAARASSLPRDERHPRRAALLRDRPRDLRCDAAPHAAPASTRRCCSPRYHPTERRRIATRLYIASDFHAAEKAWRKFLNAIKLNVYKADVALIAGDLTGKAIVPIVESDGGYEAELFGVHRTAHSDDELAQLQRDIADVGYYSFVTTAEEAERLVDDEPSATRCCTG